jgi:hypothetical protein
VRECPWQTPVAFHGRIRGDGIRIRPPILDDTLHNLSGTARRQFSCLRERARHDATLHLDSRDIGLRIGTQL